MLEQFLLTLVVATLTGFLLLWLRVPGGMMVGAIVGVALLNIFFDAGHMPNWAKVVAQITAGAFIGCSITREDMRRFPHLIKPLSIMLGAMLVLNVLLGFLIDAVSPLDLLTALFSCVPGGMVDIPIIAADLGADASKVAVLQFVRMLMGIGLFPSLAVLAGRRSGELEQPLASTERPSFTLTAQWNATGFLLTVLVAACGGLLGNRLGIPAGALVLSMLAVILLKLTFCHSANMPMWARRGAQVLSGSFIGSGFSMQDALEIGYLAVPALLIVVGYSLNCFLTGKLLHRFCHMGLMESMLASTPAGASDIALISADMGVQTSNLVVMHLFRLILVISVFPQILILVARLFG